MNRKITPEVIKARTITYSPLLHTHTELVWAVQVLDNADAFAAVDEAVEEFENRANDPRQPNGLDSAERGGSSGYQEIGLPTLEPGAEVRPSFSDTHPRAARELGDLMAPPEREPDPALAERLSRGIEQAERGETRDLGDFSQYVDEGTEG